VRLVYRGKASPLWTHVSAGNKTWVNRDIAKPPRSLDRARQLLREAGFSWTKEGRLIDPSHNEVSFSIMTSAGNAQRAQIATIIQDDLKQLGMKVSIVALEFRAMLDRVFRSHEYEAAVMTLASGDTDPNSDMNVWTLKGATHLWNLNGGPAEDWELEIDGLMREQMTTLNPEVRKRLYDRVQFLVATHLPIASLLSPHVLVGASERLGNFRPSILRPYALWNADELYFREGRGPVR
jgi:peptide/nickel transport system substrate-binding protein